MTDQSLGWVRIGVSSYYCNKRIAYVLSVVPEKLIEREIKRIRNQGKAAIFVEYIHEVDINIRQQRRILQKQKQERLQHLAKSFYDVDRKEETIWLKEDMLNGNRDRKIRMEHSIAYPTSQALPESFITTEEYAEAILGQR